VLAEFLTICREDGRTLLIVSHDETLFQGADQVLEMTTINRASEC